MSPHKIAVTTIEELLALPEDGMRHELLDGQHAVTPAPGLPHQAVVREIVLVLGQGLAGREFDLFFSPADVVLEPQTLVQPDIFIIEGKPGTILKAWSDIGVPVLAVEVLSPSTATRDRTTKRRIYQKAGVGEYWIVDIDARMIERWMPQDERPEILDTTIDWAPPDGPPLTVDIAALFEPRGPAK